jgi:hypothetical protein
MSPHIFGLLLRHDVRGTGRYGAMRMSELTTANYGKQSVSGQYVFAWKPYCPILSATVTAMYVASYIIKFNYINLY